MARRKLATPPIPAPPAPSAPSDRSLTFVCDGEERPVSLRAPMTIRRDGAELVQLIDLWVASLLPGDFLDLVFEIVTCGPAGEVTCSAPIDPMLFARGYVDLATRVLRWDDPGDCPLHGLSARSVVVQLPHRPLLPVEATKPALPGVISVAEIQRLLPFTARTYPAVELRSAPIERTERVERFERSQRLERGGDELLGGRRHRIAC